MLACHLMGMSVFSHERLLAPLLGAANLQRKAGSHFMLNNLPGFSLSVYTLVSVHQGRTPLA